MGGNLRQASLRMARQNSPVQKLINRVMLLCYRPLLL